MKSFSIACFNFQLPYKLLEIEKLQALMEDRIENQVGVLEENAVISQEQGDKLCRERYGDLEYLAKDSFQDK